MKKVILITLILLTNFSFGQKNDPDVILERVKENFSRIKDYQVIIKVKVDVEFIKVPDMTAVLYFKQPDKMHLDSKGFAMLPKSGMNISPASLLSGNYTSFYEKEEVLNGIPASIIKIIPLGGEGNVVLSTLWIDSKKNRIMKVESTTKTEGTYLIELKYDSNSEYPLPSEMIFSFNIEKMNLPKGLGGDVNTKPDKEKEDKTTTGRVFINYSGYKVNKGISDEVFTEPEK